VTLSGVAAEEEDAGMVEETMLLARLLFLSVRALSRWEAVLPRRRRRSTGVGGVHGGGRRPRGGSDGRRPRGLRGGGGGLWLSPVMGGAWGGDGRRRRRWEVRAGEELSEERSGGEMWGVWHVNRYTSTAGGQTRAYARGTRFLWRSAGRRPPVVISFSGGRRKLSARGEATNGVRDGWPPEVIFFLLYLLFLYSCI